MATILCYGDSNTHGSKPSVRLGESDRLPAGARWPDAMAAELGPDHQVIAEGLGGRTTVHDDPIEGGRRSGIDLLSAILMSHRPLDLMLVMLGTNDLKPCFSVTVSKIARSLERLVIEARWCLSGLDIGVIAPAPLAPAGVMRDLFNGAEQRQMHLNDELQAMARRQDCGFINAGDHVTVSPVDGVHWDETGHSDFGVAAAQFVRARIARTR